MRNGTYTARRRATTTSAWRQNGNRGAYFDYGSSAAGFSRNRNTVRHTSRTFGPMTVMIVVCMQVLVMGVMYVTQGTRAVSYDYELSSIEAEIEDMEAKRDDLAVEKARLASIANAEMATVAANMEEAVAADRLE